MIRVGNCGLQEEDVDSIVEAWRPKDGASIRVGSCGVQEGVLERWRPRELADADDWEIVEWKERRGGVASQG